MKTAAFTATPVPGIAGAAKVGQILKATAGTWKPGPVVLSYQWKRAGVVIAGATLSSYKPTTADLGKSLTVSVTGKKAGYSSVVKTSAATAAVTTVFTATPVPTVAGTTKVGQTLTATAGTWAPGPVVLSYQWKRAGVAITGATSRTYVVRPGDADAALSVTVTGKRANFTTVAKQSTNTAKVVGLVYKSCAALNVAYPHGVAKAGVTSDRVSGANRALKGPPYFSTTVYTLNAARDRDKDSIACEG